MNYLQRISKYPFVLFIVLFIRVLYTSYFRKGGNLVANMSSLKQKIWGGTSTRTDPNPKSPLLPSLSDSQLSISSNKTKDITPKSSQTSLNDPSGNDVSQDDEFYDPNDGKS